jgi:2-keto-3-deoxy-galactonokinase
MWLTYVQLFPPAATETIAKPCVVTDAEGNILVWFLPGLLANEKQVNLYLKSI